jgi:hypothetical protein
MITRAKNFDKLNMNKENIQNFKNEMSILINEVKEKPLKNLEVI